MGAYPCYGCLWLQWLQLFCSVMQRHACVCVCARACVHTCPRAPPPLCGPSSVTLPIKHVNQQTFSARRPCLPGSGDLG